MPHVLAPSYSLAPRAFIAADRPEALATEAESSGFQIGWTCPADALPTRAAMPPADVVIVDAGPAGDDLLDAIDDLLDHRMPVVVRYGEDEWERVAGRLGGSEAVLIGGSNAGELAGALTLLRLAPSDRLQDTAATPDAIRLQLLADQVSRIARTLAEMTDGGPALGRRGGLRSPVDSFGLERNVMTTDAPVTAKAVRAVIAERRLRDEFLDPELFGEPAWDMLLDLYAARLEHTQVSVSSLCIAAAVPSTTALRWLRTLTMSGLVSRRSDPHDKRRVFIELGDGVTNGMNGYFRALAQ